MFCSALLGKPSLLSPLFVTLVIDESFEAVFNPMAEEMRLLPIHCFYFRRRVFRLGSVPDLHAQNTSNWSQQLDVSPMTAKHAEQGSVSYSNGLWKSGRVVTSFAD
jgi:hypothetical protein